MANQLYVLPASGATVSDVQRALFERASVASAQPVSTASQVIEDSLDEFVGVFRVLEAFILLLTLLIAYNATRIGVDERAREHATLFAFGLPVRRVVGIDVVENLLIGTAGTILGVVAGLGVLGWFTRVLLAQTMPEMGVDVTIAPSTLLVAVVVGVGAVAAAPLLTIRRLQRMDIPDTLRVVE